MPQVFRSIQLYVCLVLLPQLLYLLTDSHGWAAVCESCTPSTHLELYLQSLLHSLASSSEPGRRSSPFDDTCDALVSGDEADTVTHAERTRLDQGLERLSDVSNKFIEVLDDSASTDDLCSCSSEKFNASTDGDTTETSSDSLREGGWYVKRVQLLYSCIAFFMSH